MKNPVIFRNISACFILIVAGILSACNEDIQYDVTGDPVNRVFLNVGNYTVNSYNSFSFLITHTPVGSFGDPVTAKFPVHCTLEATAETRVTLEPDNSQVDTYNAQNNTGYKALPNGLAELSTSVLTINRGELASSDSVTISIPGDKFSQLTEAAGYVLPVKITAINNTNNTAISSNLNTVYLIIKTRETNCYDSPVAGDMVGTLISGRSAWSATLDVNPSSGTLSRMFDGGTNTYWYVNPAKRCVLTVNLAAVYTGITGIRIHSYNASYALTSVVVSTSNDGENWNLQGTAKLSIASAYQYIKFYSPVNARYIRLDITGWRSASYVILSEFDVYTAQ
ncbi:MAG: BT_3987 domain-containing protein [Mangrovibacterium sp.]